MCDYIIDMPGLAGCLVPHKIQFKTGGIIATRHQGRGLLSRRALELLVPADDLASASPSDLTVID